MDDEVSQPCAVTVTVPARLHLGFLDLNGGLGRRFGGIGLAIGGLGTRLTIERAGKAKPPAPTPIESRSICKKSSDCCRFAADTA